MRAQARARTWIVLGCLAACSGESGDTAAGSSQEASPRPDAEAAQTVAAAALAKPAAVGPIDVDASFRAPPGSARDPGPRAGPAGAGAPLANLTAPQRAAFDAGKEDFEEAENVEEGLGPTMNLDSCVGCHSHPAAGGTSPPVNPQVAFARKNGAANVLPPFITANGPVREARFVRNADGSPDGGVHALFTISGRADAPNCRLAQPNFAAQLARRNVVLRIPTPLFGAGLIEAIPDAEILRSQAAAAEAKRQLGIRGRPNLLLAAGSISGQPNKNGNDGTIGRFGWKAQNKSLLIFSGEAYNVEMGITNAAFPTERDETEGCNEAPMPNSDSTLDGATPAAVLSSIERFAIFMRFLAPPVPSRDTPGGAASIGRGRDAFTSVGCTLCHTPSMKSYKASVTALAERQAELYSDLLLHDMGRGLADGIQQGQASGREFRTAPLWGMGQRLFFLHDGRTADLRQAIAEHASDGSEANVVVRRFFALPDAQQQDVLNFLRSL
jgi:CxxC motif-containing protein (DUF1111 family)